MLGLATKLLDAGKRGEIRRGREVQQLDLGYPESPLALEAPKRHEGLIAGDRAPDARLRGAAGQPERLFDLFQGPHWTLLGNAVTRDAVAPRAGLRIHTVGSRGDILDEGSELRRTYGLDAGDWVLVRPDGYVGAIVSSREIGALEDYLRGVGLN